MLFAHPNGHVGAGKRSGVSLKPTPSQRHFLFFGPLPQWRSGGEPFTAKRGGIVVDWLIQLHKTCSGLSSCNG